MEVKIVQALDGCLSVASPFDFMSLFLHAKGLGNLVIARDQEFKRNYRAEDMEDPIVLEIHKTFAGAVSNYAFFLLEISSLDYAGCLSQADGAAEAIAAFVLSKLLIRKFHEKRIFEDEHVAAIPLKENSNACLVPHVNCCSSDGVMPLGCLPTSQSLVVEAMHTMFDSLHRFFSVTLQDARMVGVKRKYTMIQNGRSTRRDGPSASVCAVFGKSPIELEPPKLSELTEFRLSLPAFL